MIPNLGSECIGPPDFEMYLNAPGGWRVHLPCGRCSRVGMTCKARPGSEATGVALLQQLLASLLAKRKEVVAAQAPEEKRK
jgi:hypothetical protein